MAVKMKMKSSDAEALLNELGVNPHLIDDAKAVGISTWVTGSKIQFVWGTPALPVGTVTLKEGVLTLVKNGVLKKNSLGHLTAIVNSELTKAVDYAKMNSKSYLKESILDASEGEVVDDPLAHPKKSEPDAAEVIADKIKAKVKPPELVMALDPVLLADANQLYQPVTGTSGGSVYYVMALRPDLKVAARAKGGKLSVRFEGDVTKYQPNFAQLGLGMASEKHASMHVEVTTLDMARRTIGAVIFGMGLEWSTDYPKVDHIWQKGA